MKTKLASLALAVAALSAAAGVADANDHGRMAPGIRYGGGGTPVPAPVPVPDMPSLWYVSLSAGYAVASSGKIETTGPDIGAYGGFDELSGPMNFGFGIGRQLWGNFRGEVDFTFRPKQKVSRPHGSAYTASTTTQSGTVDITSGGETRTTPTYDVTTFAVNRDEQARNAN